MILTMVYTVLLLDFINHLMWLPANPSSVFGKINHAVVIAVALPSVLPLVLADVLVCPDSCWCDSGDTKSIAVCWHHNLTRIPQYFDKQLQEIALMFNNITVINDYAFHGLSNVSIMLLQYNGIREVHEQAFDGLVNLTYLDLSHNKIVKIPPTVTQNNEKLDFLYLNHNEISILGPFLFSVSLSVLDISFCQITFLPHDAFIGTPNLMKLKINDNHITEFEIYAFRGLRKLEALNCGNNLIKGLNSNLFSGLDDLKYVDFSNNSISVISPRLFAYNRKLRYLFLKNNSLSIPNTGPILISESLSHLDISFCNITSISSEAFINLTNLTSLRMIGNPLRHLNTKAMEPLNKLQVILFGPDASCSESSLKNIFKYFQQKSVSYYAPPLCSIDSAVTKPTIFYSSHPSPTMPPSQILQTNISDIIFHSKHPPSISNSSQLKVLVHVTHEHTILILAVSCILKICR